MNLIKCDDGSYALQSGGITICDGLAKEHATYIFRAVNTHAQLLAALQDAIDDLNIDGTFSAQDIMRTIEEVRDSLTAAIAAAQGKE